MEGKPMLEAELRIRDFKIHVEGEGPVRSVVSLFEGFDEAFGVSGRVKTRVLYRLGDRRRVAYNLFVTPEDLSLTVTGEGADTIEGFQNVTESFVERFRVTGVALMPDFEDISLGIEVDRDHD